MAGGDRRAACPIPWRHRRHRGLGGRCGSDSRRRFGWRRPSASVRSAQRAESASPREQALLRSPRSGSTGAAASGSTAADSAGSRSASSSVPPTMSGSRMSASKAKGTAARSSPALDSPAKGACRCRRCSTHEDRDRRRLHVHHREAAQRIVDADLGNTRRGSRLHRWPLPTSKPSRSIVKSPSRPAAGGRRRWSVVSARGAGLLIGHEELQLGAGFVVRSFGVRRRGNQEVELAGCDFRVLVRRHVVRWRIMRGRVRAEARHLETVECDAPTGASGTASMEPDPNAVGSRSSMLPPTSERCPRGWSSRARQ